MRKLYLLLTLLVSLNCFSQAGRKLSSFLSLQVNGALYDRTIQNNKVGVGAGLQTQLNTRSRVKPALELNADAFAGNKILYLTADGKPVDGKNGVISIYAGPLFEPTERLFIMTTLGTSFYNSKAHVGIRPSVGIYPSKSKKWMAKASFTNIFDRTDIGHKSFGYASFALAFKLF